MKESNFANGFEYHCACCGEFFSVSLESGPLCTVEHCPLCGEHYVVNNIEQLLRACEEHRVDPVSVCSAFPPDEPIPGSRTGATPREVSIITDLVAMRRHRGLPLSVEDIAGPCDSQIEIVKKVFEEFHITETGGEG